MTTPGDLTYPSIFKETEGVNLIDSYSLDGFRLSTDTKVLGPCIIFPNAVLKWVVSGPGDLTGPVNISVPCRSP
jgi:hypothetical protein